MKNFTLIILTLALISCGNLQKSSDQPSHDQTPTQQNISTMPIDQVRKYATHIHALCYRTIYGYDGVSKNYEEAYSWCHKGADTQKLFSFIKQLPKATTCTHSTSFILCIREAKAPIKMMT